MMERARFEAIARLGLPMVAGMLSQNLLNLVDTAMVGVLGPTALAAVGIGSYANFMAIALFIGLGSGVQAMVARREGEGRREMTAVPLNGGLLLSVALGLPTLAVLFVLAPDFMPLINPDPAVTAEGTPYFQARLVGVVAVGMTFAFRGYWNGVNLPQIHFQVLLVTHLSNIVINYVLIFGALGFPALGTLGAGVGSALATYLGLGVHFVLALRMARENGFLHGIPAAETMLTMVRVGLPAALHQFLFAAGITALFWIIGQVGTVEVAVSSVLVNLLLVAFLPGAGLGLAAASLVGQALGRGEADDARRWGWDVVKVAAATMTAIALPALVVPDIILSGFLHEADAIEIARWPLRLIALMMAVEAVGLVLTNALLGAGASHQVLAINVSLQWLMGLPLAWLAGPYFGLGLIGIWVAHASYRTVQAAILARLWAGERWTRIEV